MINQAREADIYDVMERYPAATYEEVLNIVKPSGVFKPDNVRELLEDFIADLTHLDDERRKFAGTIELAVERGASFREIYGDDNEMTYFELLDIQSIACYDSLDILQKICMDHDYECDIDEVQRTVYVPKLEYFGDKI